MVNTYSPALDFFPLEESARPRPVRVRYPSVPSAVRLLRLKFRLLHLVSEEWTFREAWKLFCTPRRLPEKAWEAPLLAQARAFTVPFEGGLIAAYAWGQEVAPTVVLIHGWEHRASFWGAFVRGLTAAGYRVVALDGPAHGASPGRSTTLPGFGQAVQAVADAVGPVHAAVAHSFGAAATVGLPVYFNGPGEVLPRLVVMSAPGSTRGVAQRFARLLHLPDSIIQRMERFIQEEFGRSADSFSLTQAGATMPAARTLLIHDQQDEAVPFSEGEAIARNWPGIAFHPTNGLGHTRIMRDSGLVQQVVDFISA